LPIVTGTAFYHRYSYPKIEDNVFTRNGGNGISVARSAQEIRNNVFQDTGFGLAIGGTSEPLVAENQIIENADGLLVSDSARPVLRNNVIEKTSGMASWQPLMLNPISAAQKVKVSFAQRSLRVYNTNVTIP